MYHPGLKFAHNNNTNNANILSLFFVEYGLNPLSLVEISFTDKSVK